MSDDQQEGESEIWPPPTIHAEMPNPPAQSGGKLLAYFLLSLAVTTSFVGAFLCPNRPIHWVKWGNIHLMGPEVAAFGTADEFAAV